MIKINLLPVKELMRKRMLIQHAVIGLIPIIVAIIVILIFDFSISYRVKQLDEKIAKHRDEIKKLDVIIGKINKLEKDKTELEEKLKVISKLNKNRSIPVHILDELSKSMPEKLWLDDLEQNGPHLRLKGVGLDNETIVDFINNLKKSEYFGWVELQVSMQFENAGLKLKKFEITCQTRVPSPDQEG